MESSESIFQFLMVMISIVIGFGVTELLGGSARLLRSRKRAKPYWLHTVTIFGVFFAQLTIWWETWGLRLIPNWSFPAVVFMLSIPICLFLISSLMFPDEVTDCDFREYYMENFQLIWVIAIIATVLGTTFRPLVFGHNVLDFDNLNSLLQVLIAATICMTRKQSIHAVLVPLFFLVMIFDQLVFRYFIDRF